MSIKIAPSLLSADFGRLAEEIHLIEQAGADLFHLDIMDGHFVPNLTFGIPVIEAIAKASSLPLDAHLMVANPVDYINPLSQLGVKYFSFHIEAATHSHRLIEMVKQKKMKAGIAINPGTSTNQVIDLLPLLDFVVIMSVNPGFAAQAFIPLAVWKVEQLSTYRKEHNLNFEIEIDGGINAQTIRQIRSAGTDIVVAGSFIFKHADYANAIAALR